MAVTNNDYLGHDQSRAKLMHDWAENVIKRWINEIKAQDVSHPDKLISSLRKRVYNAAGGDQGLMPLLGWLLGSRFSLYITAIDHWIAFVLLGLIGVNMIRYFGPVRNIQKHPDSNTRLSPGCCLYSNNGFIRWPLY